MQNNDIEQKWQDNQRVYFSQNWNKKWSTLFNDKKDLKDKIMILRYEKFYYVNNAFAKLNKALQICKFLYQLGKSNPPQDTEKIILTTLISCAEAVYRINKPNELINENLVKGFLKPVKQQLVYKIRGYVSNMPYAKVFEPAEVLYLLRNDYIHNGNFTGIFFRNPQEECHSYNLGSFYYSEKENMTKLIQAFYECNLTYKDFLKIFLDAFIKTIEKYCNHE